MTNTPVSSISTTTIPTMTLELIRPDWPAPPAVQAASTTRSGGLSEGPWASLNLGDHVGDDPRAVAGNRQALVSALQLPASPHWLQQLHGTAVYASSSDSRCADACFEDRPGQVCAVMTADCLPVLMCNRSGTAVAAAHAGWRGLLAGVLEATLGRFTDQPGELMAWLGPAIGPQAFEVGDDVRHAFVADHPSAAMHFRPHGEAHWLMDLYGLARDRLGRAGVASISGGGLCTLSDPARFFSYRRDGITGRMASLIWLQP